MPDSDATALLVQGDERQQQNTTSYSAVNGAKEGDVERSAEKPSLFSRYLSKLLPHGSVTASAINMAKASLGVGTLGWAAAFQKCGIGIGILFTVFICCCTVFSIKLLCHCIEQTKATTYEDLVAKLIHPRAKHLLSAIIVVFYWGTTILYVIAIGQILHPLTDSDSFPSWMHGERGTRIVTSIFWAALMLPLSLLKEMNSLRFSSALGLVTIFILMFSIIYHAESDGPNWADANYTKFEPSLLAALPTICFSFSCQAFCFSVYHEMKEPTPRRMTIATSWGMLISMIVYLCCAVWGAVNFGSQIKGDILQNYTDPTSEAYLMVAFIGMGTTITLSFPVCIVPTRDSILQVLGYRDVYSTPTLTRIAVASFLAATSLVIGLFVSNISVVFDLLGGICASSVAFIFPAVLALRSEGFNIAEQGLPTIIGTWGLLTTGAITLVLGTSVSCYNQFSS